MGRMLTQRVRRSTVGRVATTFVLVTVGMTVAACGSSEPVTAETPAVRPNAETMRPECVHGESISLGESTSRNQYVTATSSWGEATIELEAFTDFHLVSVLAEQGRELHGFYNLKEIEDVAAGDKILLEARKFTVSPDFTATMTHIDSASLCIQK